MVDVSVLHRWAKPGADLQAINEAHLCLTRSGKVLPLATIANQFHEPMAKLIRDRPHHKGLTKGLETMPTFSRALNTLSHLQVDEHGAQSGAFMAVFVPSDRMIEDGAKFGTYDDVVEASAFSSNPFPNSLWPLFDDVTANELEREDTTVLSVKRNGNIHGFADAWGPCRLFTKLQFAGTFITVYGLCKIEEGT